MAAKLRLTQYISFALEKKLTGERGFTVFSRLNGGGLVLTKGYDDKPKVPPWEEAKKEPENFWEISPERAAELEKRCERVYDTFCDPYNQIDVIRRAIMQMCKNVHLNDVETEWVENWVYTNVL